jgi:hypothetical protein
MTLTGAGGKNPGMIGQKSPAASGNSAGPHLYSAVQSLTYVSLPVAKKHDPAEEIGKESFRKVMDEHLAACKARGR